MPIRSYMGLATLPIPLPNPGKAISYAWRGLSHSQLETPPSYTASAAGAGQPQTGATVNMGISPEALELALALEKARKEAPESALFAAQAQSTLAACQTAHERGQAVFSREMYQASLVFLLRGLPTDMTVMERSAMKAAILGASERSGLGLADETALADALAAMEATATLATAAQDAAKPSPETEAVKSRLGDLLVLCIRGAAIAARVTLPKIQQGIALEQEHKVLERGCLLLLTLLTRSVGQLNRLPISSLTDGVLEGILRGIDEAQKVFQEDVIPSNRKPASTP